MTWLKKYNLSTMTGRDEIVWISCIMGIVFHDPPHPDPLPPGERGFMDYVWRMMLRLRIVICQGSFP
jgi:hypothetical protein